MNLRWLLGDFTDPQHRLSGTERRRLSWLAHRRFVTTRRFAWFTIVTMVAPVLLVLAFVAPIATGWLGGSNGDMVVVTGAVLALFWVWCAWMYRVLYARPIRMAMRSEGHDVCLDCGYELAGLAPETERCPECGAERPVDDAPPTR